MKNTRRILLNIAKTKCNHQERQRRAMVVATGSRCMRCRKHDYMTRDHVIPISHGGDNGIYNIQPLCYDCNRSKHARAKDYRNSDDMECITLNLYLTDCQCVDFDIGSVYKSPSIESILASPASLCSS